ncbi:MAG: PEP-CTERM sorting domain-containing protein [Pseudomonadota bacterium]
MSFIRKSLIAAGLALGLSSVAVAGPIYSYEDSTGGGTLGNGGAGKLKEVTTSFDTNTDMFSWSYTIGKKMGMHSDGFWLVVTDGPNPKQHDNEYAILYGDVDNNRLSVYEYNGQNSSNSWNTPGRLLATYDGAMNVSMMSGKRTVDFSIDVSAVNNPGHPNLSPAVTPADWRGVQLGESLGVWFHPSVNTGVSYNADNEITGFNYSKQGWYDFGNRETDVEYVPDVPEPHTLLIFTVGLLGFAASRKFRKA